MRLKILPILLILIPILGFGQESTVIFDVINEDDGKHAMRTAEIFEDHEGILWFGGFDGLTSYDGFTFQNYPAQTYSDGYVNGNVIWSIDEDNTGRLWLGTRNYGLNYSDNKKQKFFSLDSLADGKLAISKTIEDIVVDSINRIWITGNRGVQILHEIDNKIIGIPTTQLIPDSSSAFHTITPRVMYSDKLGRLWMGGKDGLSIFDTRDSSYLNSTNQPGLIDDFVDDIQEDRQGNIWISRKSPESRFVYYPDGQLDDPHQFSKIPMQSNRRRIHFSFDTDNRLWAAVFAEQVYGFDFRDSTVFFRSTVNSNVPQERFTRRPFCDSHGNVWIPSTNVIKHNYSRNFRNIQRTVDDQSITTAVLVEDGKKYIAYRERGLIATDNNSKQEEFFSTSGEGYYQIPTNLIHSFTRLSNGKLALVGFPWLIILDEKNKQKTTHRLKGTSQGAYEDDKGNLWIGGFYGLEKRTLEGDLIKTYSLPPRRNDRRNMIRRAVEDSAGNLWFGGYNSGLGKLNPNTEEIKYFHPDKSGKSVPSFYITDLQIAHDGSLLVASDLGLSIMDIEKEEFLTINHQSGLQNQYINAVMQDSNQNIWCSSNDGLIRLDPETFEIEQFNMKDGLLNSAYSLGVKCEHDGIFYFGGNKGIDYFNPYEIRGQYSKLSLKLLGFKIDNKKTLSTDSILSLDKLSLSHKNDLIEIVYGATRFLTKEAIEYSYLIDGLHEDWVSLGTQRRTLLSDLQPGDYKVKLRVRQLGENWSKDELHIPIQIRSPWWQRLWARILFVTLLLGMIYFYIKKREQIAKKKEQEASKTKELILKLEKKALLSQMNPHFIFNSMNAIQQFIAERNNEGAMRFLSKFSRLLRQVINVSNSDRISLHDEIQLLQKYLEVERMRFPSKFMYQLHVEPTLDRLHTFLPVFLIQPHVEQAVFQSTQRMNEKGHVKISISRSQAYARVLIEDNGTGNLDERNQNNIQHGTSIVEQRLKHLNKSIGHQKIDRQLIYTEDGSICGCRVELLIKIV